MDADGAAAAKVKAARRTASRIRSRLRIFIPLPKRHPPSPIMRSRRHSPLPWTNLGPSTGQAVDADGGGGAGAAAGMAISGSTVRRRFRPRRRPLPASCHRRSNPLKPSGHAPSERMPSALKSRNLPSNARRARRRRNGRKARNRPHPSAAAGGSASSNRISGDARLRADAPPRPYDFRLRHKRTGQIPIRASDRNRHPVLPPRRYRREFGGKNLRCHW